MAEVQPEHAALLARRSTHAAHPGALSPAARRQDRRVCAARMDLGSAQLCRTTAQVAAAPPQLPAGAACMHRIRVATPIRNGHTNSFSLKDYWETSVCSRTTDPTGTHLAGSSVMSSRPTLMDPS